MCCINLAEYGSVDGEDWLRCGNKVCASPIAEAREDMGSWKVG